MHASAQPVAPGEQARARGRAKRTDEVPFELDAFTPEAIESRCLQMRIPVQAEVAIPLIIGDYDQHVRLRGIRVAKSSAQQQRQREAAGKDIEFCFRR